MPPSPAQAVAALPLPHSGGGAAWARIIGALLVRAVRIAGRQPLAFLWLLFEPFLQIAFIVSILLLMGKTSIQGVHSVPFVVLGVNGWLVFRQPILRVGLNYGADRALLLFPPVQPADIFVARAGMIGVIYAIVALVTLGVVQALGYGEPIDNPLAVAGAWIGIWMMGLGLGLALASVTEPMPWARWVAFGALRILYFLSGVFFVSEQLPEDIAKWLQWNPVLHALQLLRAGYSANYESHYADPYMVAGAAALFLMFGFACFHRSRRRPTHP